MHLILVYNNAETKESIETLCKEYGVAIDSFKDKTPKAFKIKGYYGTKLAPFAVFKKDQMEIPFYSDNNDFSVEHIKEILNRHVE